MTRLILIGFLLNSCLSLFAQDSKIDSLEMVLRTSDSPIETVGLLFELVDVTKRSMVDKKLDYASRALNLSRQLDDPAYLMKSYFYMSSATRLTKDYDAALIYVDSSIVIAKTIKDTSFLAKDLSQKAWLSSRIKKNAKQSPEKLYFKSLDLYRAIDDKKGAASCLNNLSWVKRKKGNMKESNAFAQKALDLGKTNNDPEAIMTACLNLAQVCLRKSDYEKSIDHCHQALGVAIKDQRKDKQGNINNLISIAYNKSGKYNESIEHSNKAFELYDSIQDTIGIGNSLLNKGVSYKRMGKYDKALEVYLLSCQYMESQDNQRGISNAYTNVGLIYKEMENYEKAMEFFEKALALKIEAGDHEGSGRVYNNMGTTHLKQKLYDEALDYFFKAYDVHKKTTNKNSQGIALVNTGETYLRLQQFGKAFDYMYRSLAIFNEVGSKSGRSGTLNLIAETYIELKKYPEQASILQIENKSNFEIEDMLIQSKDLAEEINDFGDLQTSYLSLVEFYRSTNSEEALVYQDKLMAIKDSVYQSEKLSTIAEMQTRFDIDSKERENEYLKENNALIKSRNRLYLWGALALLALLITVLYGYLQLKKVKQKLEVQNTTIEDQNEQLINLNQTKDRFFGIIAHDLKSPLIALQGLGKRINFLLRSNDQDQLMALGSHVDGTSTKLNNLLDNLLNWASIQTGDIPYHPQTLNLFDIAEDVVSLFENNASKKGVDLQMNIDPEILVYADERAVNTILRNLLSNAVKFTPGGGLVSLKAIEKNQQIHIYLKDTGEGMDSEKLKNLFTLNKKSTSGTAGEKGTGLGLVLCKVLVELNKGILKVTSTKNKGSCFEFTLPLHQKLVNKTLP